MERTRMTTADVAEGLLCARHHTSPFPCSVTPIGRKQDAEEFSDLCKLRSPISKVACLAAELDTLWVLCAYSIS